MYVEKEELRDTDIITKVKVLVKWNYNASLCSPYWAKMETSIEVKEIHFDFGSGIVIKIPADYVSQNCLRDESFWHLIFEKLGY